MKTEDILNSIQIGHGGEHGDYEIVNYEDVLEMIQKYPSLKVNKCIGDLNNTIDKLNKENLALEAQVEILQQTIIVTLSGAR